MSNIYNDNSNITSDQDIYDNFNKFIWSKDRNVFNKLASKIQFYNQTKNLHGDILECGVFKASGLFAWLKILDMHEPNSIKKVIGLDYFGSEFVDNLSGIDQEMMSQVFKRDSGLQNNDISEQGINDKLIRANFKSDKFELIRGDVSKTSSELARNRPGLRISLINLDLDLYEPTIECVTNLWDNIVSGGIIIFDEYGYHGWSESKAADEICKKFDVELHSTFLKTPTAYIVKP